MRKNAPLHPQTASNVFLGMCTTKCESRRQPTAFSTLQAKQKTRSGSIRAGTWLSNCFFLSHISLRLKSVVPPIRQDARLFRSAQPHNAIDRVRRTLLRCMEMPHLQFSQQSDRQHLNTSQYQHACNYKQRPMHIHYVLV